MNSSATVDPVRVQVEETLRNFVDAVTTVPCRLVRRSRDAAGRAVERATESVTTSIGLARSVGELAFGSLFGIGHVTMAPSTARPPSDLPKRPVSPEPNVDTRPSDPVERTTSAAEQLPLEDYESLAASHVVARLARLSPDDLASIREFEEANRGRRTILGKIEQLLHT